MNQWRQFLYLFLILISTVVYTKTKEEWKTRIIYHLITDRFARTDEKLTECNVREYCGGSFTGIKINLDYITNMGFNAIWISPIQENTQNGYHGYYMTDLYAINHNFGTEEDLIDLISECHKRDVWVMFDIVANHSGPVGDDYHLINPFNNESYYHEFCVIEEGDFHNDQNKVENCRLAGLPDFKQEDPFVRETLYLWIENIVKKYKIDGIRIDTVCEVPKWFWADFAKRAGVFQIGEAANYRLDYVADYQLYLDGLLNFPLYYTLNDIFIRGQSFYNLEWNLIQTKKHFKDPGLLSPFIDNHDFPRFLNQTTNVQRFENAIAYILTSDGIPIFYYGDEQNFNGGREPNSRESLWGHMDQDSHTYRLVSKLVKFRIDQRLWEKTQIQRYAENNFYAFTKENILILLTNTDAIIERTITYHSFAEHTKLCNLFDPNDCVKVQDMKIIVRLKSDFKVYIVENNNQEKISNIIYNSVRNVCYFGYFGSYY